MTIAFRLNAVQQTDQARLQRTIFLQTKFVSLNELGTEETEWVLAVESGSGSNETEGQGTALLAGG